MPWLKSAETLISASSNRLEMRIAVVKHWLRNFAILGGKKIIWRSVVKFFVLHLHECIPTDRSFLPCDLSRMQAVAFLHFRSYGLADVADEKRFQCSQSDPC